MRPHSLGILFAACMVATAPQAQIDEAVSREHAARALELLLEAGDQDAAIKEALSGLPAAPTESDLDQNRAAWSALWRAMADRSIETDLLQQVFGMLTPDGTRAIVVVMSPNGSDGNVQIIDTATEDIISDTRLAQPRIDAMAPSGAFAVVTSANGLHFADMETGRLSEAVLPGGHSAAMISPNGKFLALTRIEGLSINPVTLEIFDMSIGAKVSSDTHPPFSTFAWRSNDELIRITNTSGYEFPPIVDVEILRLDGARTPVLAGHPLDFQLYGLLADARMGERFVITGSETSAVYSFSGDREAEIAVDVYGLGVGVGGQTLIAPLMQQAVGIAEMEVATFDLMGARIDTRPENYAPFTQIVFGQGNAMLGPLGGFIGSAMYFGGDTPTGIDLHRAALDRVGSGSGGSTYAAVPQIDADIAASRAFAQEADRLLRAGKRGDAIAAAMKGLPADPKAEDFQRYEAAYTLLYRSVAGRSVELPEEADGPLALSPDGERIAAIGIDPGLYSAIDGTRLVSLRVPDGRELVSSTYPVFSPDGAHLAVMEKTDTVLHVFDGVAGDHIATIRLDAPSLAPLPAYSTAISSPGFSHDGSHLAIETTKDSGIHVAPTDSWEPRRLDLPQQATSGLVNWIPDNRMVIVNPVFDGTTGLVARIFQHDLRSATLIRDVPASDEGLRDEPLAVRVSADGRALMLTESGGASDRRVLFDASGQATATIELHSDLTVFVRDGKAVATHFSGGDLTSGLRVTSTSGEDLAPLLKDYPALDQFAVISGGSSPRTLGARASSARYRGQEVPTGIALYEMARGDLTPEQIADVEAERISR